MSGEEGETNDAVRGSSQPAELCHLLSGWRCSAPACPGRPGLPSTHSTTLPPHPPLHAQMHLRSCGPMDVHPNQAELGVRPDPRQGDENARLILHLPSPSWPHVESQQAGLKKGQGLAEVSARLISIQDKKFLILKAAWTMDHEGDALRLHQQEGSRAARAQTSTPGNSSVCISKIWGKKVISTFYLKDQLNQQYKRPCGTVLWARRPTESWLRDCPSRAATLQIKPASPAAPAARALGAPRNEEQSCANLQRK